MFSVAVYYLTSVQDASATHGPCSRTAHRQTLLGTHWRTCAFIEPDMWPPSSPDLNPVDYVVWGALQQMVYQRRRFTTIWAKAGDRHWVGQTVAAFHWSRHWSVASPAWVRRPAARRTHWTFDVKLHDVTVTLDNNWDNKCVVSCCYFLKMCCYRSRLVFNCCF